jgi:hypothetical protein
MYKTRVHKQLIVDEWSPRSKQAQLRNIMMLASRGKLPNAGGDTKAHMIAYLQDEFRVGLNKATSRAKVEAVLSDCLQLGNVPDQQGNHHLHGDHHLGHYCHQHSPPATIPPPQPQLMYIYIYNYHHHRTCRCKCTAGH